MQALPSLDAFAIVELHSRFTLSRAFNNHTQAQYEEKNIKF